MTHNLKRRIAADLTRQQAPRPRKRRKPLPPGAPCPCGLCYDGWSACPGSARPLTCLTTNFVPTTDTKGSNQ